LIFQETWILAGYTIGGSPLLRGWTLQRAAVINLYYSNHAYMQTFLLFH